MLAAWQEREAGLEPALAGALAGAAAAIARLDEALALHPLRPAFLHRARLEAVRRQAAVDGQLIEPWHLAAVLEGLRLRTGDAPRIIDRGSIAAAAESALALYHWLVAPGCDEEAQVQQAAHHLASFAAGATPLLAAAHATHAWLDQGGTRPPMRAALIRFWVRHEVLRAPVPLTGAAALRAETPWARSAWTVAFLHALAAEAADGRQLLTDLERAWFAARAAVDGRRRDSQAARTVDLLAARSLVSATTVARSLGLAVKTALRLLESLVAAAVAVEVSHRAKRRLFGLAGMAPLRATVLPPRRPEPGRSRGRPPLAPPEDTVGGPPPALPPLTPVERRAIDYSDLEAAMTHLDQVLRQTQRSLTTMAGRGGQPGVSGGEMARWRACAPTADDRTLRRPQGLRILTR